MNSYIRSGAIIFKSIIREHAKYSEGKGTDLLGVTNNRFRSSPGQPPTVKAIETVNAWRAPGPQQYEVRQPLVNSEVTTEAVGQHKEVFD